MDSLTMYLRFIFYVLLITLVVSCEDERQVEKDLLADCENHYRATSYKAAIKNCELAANQGIASAQWHLANIYQFDLANQGDTPDMAFPWFLKAAESGMVPAQRFVGDSYLYANGVPENFDNAFRWLSKAAENGDAQAEFSLGNMYFSGKGREKDVSSAISWFKRAAENKHPMSINNLAWIYATSKNKAFRSEKKAKYWLELLDISGEDRSVFLDTKAAVYAVAGEFNAAVDAQNEAIASLPEDIEEERLLEFQQRLEFYEKHQAWQE